MKPSRRWSSSFRYALEGIATSFKTQRHVRFHCVAAVVVIAAAMALSLPVRDVALLLLVIALVISLELVNTAIEAVVDLAAPGVASSWQDRQGCRGRGRTGRSGFCRSDRNFDLLRSGNEVAGVALKVVQAGRFELLYPYLFCLR